MRTVHRTRTRTAIATTGAVAALLIGGAAAPATAAGNGADDRSDRGSSHSAHKDSPGHDSRWQAQADPDGNENGGVDQPGGSGGVNTDDQDGNNGSGNDSDCEDDNRGKGVPGHCKDKTQPTPARGGDKAEPANDRPSGAEQGTKDSEPGELPTALPGDATEERDAEVKGIEAYAPSSPAASPMARAAASPEAAASPVAADGSEAASADSAGILPNTGADAAMLAMLLGGLTAAGAGTVLIRRRTQAD